MSPDTTLIERIIPKISDTNLFREEDLDRFREKLSNSTLTREDIILFLENKISEESGNNNEVDDE